MSNFDYYLLVPIFYHNKKILQKYKRFVRSVRISNLFGTWGSIAQIFGYPIEVDPNLGPVDFRFNQSLVYS